MFSDDIELKCTVQYCNHALLAPFISFGLILFVAWCVLNLPDCFAEFRLAFVRLTEFWLEIAGIWAKWAKRAKEKEKREDSTPTHRSFGNELNSTTESNQLVQKTVKTITSGNETHCQRGIFISSIRINAKEFRRKLPILNQPSSWLVFNSIYEFNCSLKIC